MASDQFIDGLLGKIGDGTIEGFSDSSKNSKAIAVLLSAFTALLLIAGSEPFKLLLRKNIGRSVISIRGAIISSLFYFGYSYFLYLEYRSGIWNALPLSLFGRDFDGIRLNNIFLPGVGLYLLLGIIVPVLGIKKYSRKATIHPSFRGESILFNDLLKKHQNKAKQLICWLVLEPVFILTLTSLVTVLNPLIGIPLLIQSFAFISNEYFQVLKLIYIAQNRSDVSVSSSNRIFHKVRVIYP